MRDDELLPNRWHATGAEMALDFTPQFHKRISRNDGRNIWIALPPPKTLILAKTAYYRTWQQEEYQRLMNAGEDVVMLAANH